MRSVGFWTNEQAPAGPQNSPWSAEEPVPSPHGASVADVPPLRGSVVFPTSPGAYPRANFMAAAGAAGLMQILSDGSTP